MSRKQGPRAAGMRPSARARGSLRSNGEPAGLLLARVAVGRRHDAFGNFTAIIRGDGMSRKQGPRACLGMRSAVHVVRDRLLPSVNNPPGHVLQEVRHGH